MSDWTYNQPDVMREIARLKAENAKLVEVSARLLNENASLVVLFKQVSDRVFPGHTDSVGAVREIVAENAKLKVVVDVMKESAQYKSGGISIAVDRALVELEDVMNERA